MSLRELRIRHNMTQADFGETLGVSQQTIARLETGRSSIKQPLADKIKKRFNLSVEETWDIMKNVPPRIDRRHKRGPYGGTGTKK